MDSFILSSVFVAVFGAIESKPVVLPFIELSEDASVFTGIDDDSTPVNFPTPFHFNDITYSSAYICSNGLVSFGISYNPTAPGRLPLPEYINVIAPYWDDIDLRDKGNIFFESYSNDNNIALRNISNFITNSQALSQQYNPLSAVIIYWSDVCPFGDSNCINTSSFQVVLTSDETFSYAIFTYKCGSLNWNYRRAGIGYSAGTEFYKNHILSMKLNVNDIACLNEPHSEWNNVAYRVDGVTNPVCKTDCNPTSRHPECCSDDNLGKFFEVENNSFVIRYIVCPVTKPDYCDMI